MASGYNMVGRPPVVAARDGGARLLVRRESPEDMRRRDVGLQAGEGDTGGDLTHPAVMRSRWRMAWYVVN
ncbi:hypothetical protein [Streptomyces sasae]|uniref:hypothetical protein n=1 Tax=Streptomyces sasae TaxID=1266772 RepID=UPI00292EAEDD|nr:hypothetical protein [Streptomyces sasae]